MAESRRVPFSRIILSVGITYLISVLRKCKISTEPLKIPYARHKQKLIRAPKILANLETLRVCITYSCNKECSFCYSRSFQEEFKHHMVLSDFDFLLNWAKLQGWKAIRFLGGEPTVHPEFKSILSMTEKKGFYIDLSTNGLFNSEISLFLGDKVVRSINFSYPQDENNRDEKKLFHQNLKNAMDKETELIMSCVIYPDKEDWRQVIDLASKYRPNIVVRFSMVLPNNEKCSSFERVRENFKKMSRQALDIANYALKNHVTFHFYRPFLRCMLSDADFDYLDSISPFVYYTRCPLNLGDNYAGLRLTVNPDLSCYPCPVVRTGGVKIGPKVNLSDIEHRFKHVVSTMSAQPLMDSCKTCDFFAKYQRQIKQKSFDLADKTVCQGGCFGYR